MKKKLTVYQKPTCTKCRTTLRLLKERGAEFEAITMKFRSLLRTYGAKGPGGVVSGLNCRPLGNSAARAS